MALKLRQAVHYITRSAIFIRCQPRFPAARLKLRNRLALAPWNGWVIEWLIDITFRLDAAAGGSLHHVCHYVHSPPASLPAARLKLRNRLAFCLINNRYIGFDTPVVAEGR